MSKNGTAEKKKKQGGGEKGTPSKGSKAKGDDSSASSSNTLTRERADIVRAVLRRKEEEVKTMLAPEKNMSEIDVLAKKIVAEVTALEAKGGEDGAENSEFTFLAAVESAPQFHCPVCGNRNQVMFMLDEKQGDTICLGADGDGCGTVVQDHKVHEGSMYRKFEGEADRSHHGPAPNRLYSTAHNMRTWISEGKDASRLRNLAEDVEMGLSNVGKEERKTRTAYKDQMKREAFDLVNHISGNLDLHETVVVRAKELFAGWRNAKEHVNQRDAVICACIVAAYREVSTEELSRQMELTERRNLEPAGGGGWAEDGSEDTEEDPLYPFECPECKSRFNAGKALHLHQSERHKAARVEGVELGGAGPTKSMSDWSMTEARTWLTSVIAALQLPAEHVQSISTSLEQSLRAQDAGQRVGVKRKASRTAGQLLSLLTLNRLTELCGGGAAGAAAGAKIHQETSRKRAERARRDRDRVADYNAAQRNHQNVRKPWVAHVRAELNNTNNTKNGTAVLAATTDTAAAAAAATAIATTTSGGGAAATATGEGTATITASDNPILASSSPPPTLGLHVESGAATVTVGVPNLPAASASDVQSIAVDGASASTTVAAATARAGGSAGVGDNSRMIVQPIGLESTLGMVAGGAAGGGGMVVSEPAPVVEIDLVG